MWILQTFNEAGKDWRTKELLAKNLTQYVTQFDLPIVEKEFLPMFNKFCDDKVVQVSEAAAPAISAILIKFEKHPNRQIEIISNIKNKLKDRSFKQRQLFIIMCQAVMNKTELKTIFEDHFKSDMLAMHKDRVPNVRLTLAKAIRSHFK